MKPAFRYPDTTLEVLFEKIELTAMEQLYIQAMLLAGHPIFFSHDTSERKWSMWPQRADDTVVRLVGEHLEVRVMDPRVQLYHNFHKGKE